MATYIISNDMTQPYSEWATQLLQDIARRPVRGIAVAVTIDGGDEELLTAYYRCPMMDKAKIASNIFTDAMMDVVKYNGPVIREAWENEEEEEEEEEEGEPDVH